MRIRGAKTELEAAGLDTEGMASSVATLREEVLALSGVDIMANENEFKSPFQILKELSEVWNKLEDVDRANLTDLIAGKRQGNIMSSLMNNFEIAEEALKVSQASEGSALQEHSRWLESLEAKTQQFQASWQSLSQTVLNTDFLKGAVDTGTGLLNVLEGIVDTITLPGTLAAGGGIFAFFKNLD